MSLFPKKVEYPFNRKQISEIMLCIPVTSVCYLSLQMPRTYYYMEILISCFLKCLKLVYLALSLPRLYKCPNLPIFSTQIIAQASLLL